MLPSLTYCGGASCDIHPNQVSNNPVSCIVILTSGGCTEDKSTPKPGSSIRTFPETDNLVKYSEIKY